MTGRMRTTMTTRTDKDKDKDKDIDIDGYKYKYNYKLNDCISKRTTNYFDSYKLKDDREHNKDFGNYRKETTRYVQYKFMFMYINLYYKYNI